MGAEALVLPEVIGAWELGAIGAAEGLGVAGGLGALGAGDIAGGFAGDIAAGMGGSALGAAGGALMPAAVAESAGSLAAQGLQQLGTGAWGLPAEAALGAPGIDPFGGYDQATQGWAPEVYNDPTQVSQMVQSAQATGMTPGELFNPTGSIQQNTVLGGTPGAEQLPSSLAQQTPGMFEGGMNADIYGNVDMGYGVAGNQIPQGLAQMIERSPLEKLGEYMQTPGGMFRGGQTLYTLMQQRQQAQMAKSMMEQYRQAQASAMRNQFPFNQYYGEYQKFMNNPTSYLQGMPGYQASQDFVKQAQARRNAASGNLGSGYGDSLLANVLGQNANQWYQTTGNQLGQAAGVSFNPNSAFAASQGGLPFALNSLNQSNKLGSEVAKGIGEILNSSGNLPKIFEGSY